VRISLSRLEYVFVKISLDTGPGTRKTAFARSRLAETANLALADPLAINT
jgi:hypothetical protein